MRKVLKRTAVVLGALLGLVLVAAAGLAAMGRSRFSKPYTVSHAVVTAPGDVAHGEHVMRIHGCVDCHGPNLEGRPFLDMPLGRFTAPNLTPGRGGVGTQYRTVADWDRAVRHGVRPGGQWIAPFMPYALYHGLSDEDAAALAAYLASLRPIDNVVPAREVRVPGYLALGVFSGGPAKQLAALDSVHTTPPPRGPTAAYGRYVASTSCVECHGQQLQGGKHPAPGAPEGPALHAAGRWSLAEFRTAVREGRRPDGKVLSPFMPARTVFVHLTDDETAALHAYVATLAPLARAR